MWTRKHNDPARGGTGRRWQRVAGISLIGLGLLLVVWQPLTQAYEEDNATPTFSVRAEASDQQMFGRSLSTSRLKPLSQFSPEELKPSSEPLVPVRIRIPALKIDTNVEGVGLRQGAMDVPNNIYDVGWLSSGPQPGAVGNAVLDGHKDSVRSTAIFWELGKLKVGDRLYVSDSEGNELTFEVDEVSSFGKEGAPLERIFGPSDGRHLNLITCDGTFLASQHTYDQRLVVFSHLVTDGN